LPADPAVIVALGGAAETLKSGGQLAADTDARVDKDPAAVAHAGVRKRDCMRHRRSATGLVNGGIKVCAATPPA